MFTLENLKGAHTVFIFKVLQIVWGKLLLISSLMSQVGMDKALNQLSVPLGQLREEVMVCFLNKYIVFILLY